MKFKKKETSCRVTVSETSRRKFVRSAARNLSAFLWEFMRMRVERCNVMATTVMPVTCALKRRNGTRT